MRLNKVGVLSAGKLSGLLYALLGLIFGGLFALFSLVGAGAGLSGDEAGAAGMMFGFGVAAVIIFPILYGIMGFVGGLLMAALFNLVSGISGGLEVDITQ
jgi:hypothetical protein